MKSYFKYSTSRFLSVIFQVLLITAHSRVQAQSKYGPSDNWESHISDPALIKTSLLKKENNVLSNKDYNRTTHKTKDENLRAIKQNENLKSAVDSYNRASYMYNLGILYYSIGNYQLSLENLDSCLLLNNEMEEKVGFLKIRLGFDTLYHNWVTKETEHFIFHFQDTTTEDITIYISKKEEAFNEINSFFNSTLPKKIDYYVWVYPEQAKEILNHRLSFANPTLSCVHTQFHSPLGHEMTHIISYNATRIEYKNKIIIEGIAVYFDFSKMDNINIIRLRTKKPIQIIEVWKNPDSTAEYIQYYLGAELVSRLITTFGRKKFLKYFADQSYEHAVEVYGKKLDDMLDKFQYELNR